MKKSITRLSILILTAMILSMPVKSQDVKIVSMTKYLSNCLFNFSRNINWPEENKSGDFIITIVGDKELYQEMSKLTQNMKVGMQPIVVKYFSTVGELSGYQQMVFVDSWQAGKIGMLVQKINGSHTLIVSETEGTLEKGAAINFIPVNGVMKFEINKDNLKRSNLMASSILEKMAMN
jgi:hypothetical protein